MNVVGGWRTWWMFFLLGTTLTTEALQGQIWRLRAAHGKENGKEYRPLYQFTQDDDDGGAIAVYKDKPDASISIDEEKSQDHKKIGRGSSARKDHERRSTRAVDLEFTSTLLTHCDNKLLYTLKNGKSLALRKLQYLDEVQDCASFTIKTFFDEPGSVVGAESNKEKFSRLVDRMNPFRSNNLKELNEIQMRELANRLDHPYAAMFMVEDTKQGDIIGFSEIFTQPFDQESMKFKDPLPVALTNKEYLRQNSRPKVANFCVHQDYRKQGVGKLLLSACLSQAREWGYEQALLLVDADNSSARRFYRYQGFADVAYESWMRKYDVNTMRLSSVRSPKYLMQKHLI